MPKPDKSEIHRGLVTALRAAGVNPNRKALEQAFLRDHDITQEELDVELVEMYDVLAGFHRVPPRA